jgi:hypothetical protein
LKTFTQRTPAVFRHVLEITETLANCTLLLRIQIAKTFITFANLVALFGAAL